jgi:hypothetical protein
MLPEEQAELARTPKNQISSLLIYHWNTAAKSTSPSNTEFKYLLPRMFELIALNDLQQDAEGVMAGFTDHVFSSWSKQEQSAVQEFKIAHFLHAIETWNSGNDPRITEYLSMWALAGFEVSDLFDIWETMDSSRAYLALAWELYWGFPSFAKNPYFGNKLDLAKELDRRIETFALMSEDRIAKASLNASHDIYADETCREALAVIKVLKSQRL